jgi:hypothetical protein
VKKWFSGDVSSFDKIDDLPGFIRENDAEGVLLRLSSDLNASLDKNLAVLVRAVNLAKSGGLPFDPAHWGLGDDIYVLRRSVDEEGEPHSIFILDESVDPHVYEMLFFKLHEQGVAGIAGDVEHLTRGHVALAKKFSLLSIVLGVKYERQYEKALHTNAEIICVEI